MHVFAGTSLCRTEASDKLRFSATNVHVIGLVAMKALARHLRNHQTHAELQLWQRLRRKQIHGVQVYRQRPVGRYIVDFYIPATKLIIEVDGSQHHSERGLKADAVRDANLRELGFEILRFDNRQVLIETEAVVEVIAKHIAERLQSE